ncbi:hypothetical protein M432DRAFT_593868 [Thermoascus aurantiacus ATCC 26904]
MAISEEYFPTLRQRQRYNTLRNDDDDDDDVYISIAHEIQSVSSIKEKQGGRSEVTFSPTWREMAIWDPVWFRTSWNMHSSMINMCLNSDVLEHRLSVPIHIYLSFGLQHMNSEGNWITLPTRALAYTQAAERYDRELSCCRADDLFSRNGSLYALVAQPENTQKQHGLDMLKELTGCNLWNLFFLTTVSFILPATVYGQGIYHNSIDNHSVYSHHDVQLPAHHEHHDGHHVVGRIRFYETCLSTGLGSKFKDLEPVILRPNECQNVKFDWPGESFYAVHGQAHGGRKHGCDGITA